MTRLLALLLLAAMPVAAAQLPVFAGDPIDPTTGAPYIILPGVPLVNPGPDGRFGNRDDIIDPSIIGDVDLVVRTGGGYAGGPIPAPARRNRPRRPRSSPAGRRRAAARQSVFRASSPTDSRRS